MANIGQNSGQTRAKVGRDQFARNSESARLSEPAWLTIRRNRSNLAEYGENMNEIMAKSVTKLVEFFPILREVDQVQAPFARKNSQMSALLFFVFVLLFQAKVPWRNRSGNMVVANGNTIYNGALCACAAPEAGRPHSQERASAAPHARLGSRHSMELRWQFTHERSCVIGCLCSSLFSQGRRHVVALFVLRVIL